MIKRFFTIALAALALAACAPEYDTDKLPIVIEELPTEGKGNLLSASGAETAHTYEYKITPTLVEIKATISKTAADGGWAVGYFILNSTALKEAVGDCDLSDITVFYPEGGDAWTTYEPGEWVDENGKPAAWNTGHVYWWYNNYATYEDYTVKDALVIGQNPSNSVVGETITSKNTINGVPFNVIITIAE